MYVHRQRHTSTYMYPSLFNTISHAHTTNVFVMLTFSISVLLLSTATWTGAFIRLFCRALSAPDSTRCRTTCPWPPNMATCRGRLPSLSEALISENIDVHCFNLSCRYVYQWNWLNADFETHTIIRLRRDTLYNSMVSLCRVRHSFISRVSFFYIFLHPYSITKQPTLIAIIHNVW